MDRDEVIDHDIFEGTGDYPEIKKRYEKHLEFVYEAREAFVEERDNNNPFLEWTDFYHAYSTEYVWRKSRLFKSK